MKAFLDIAELAEYLGIKRSTLYAKAAKRGIPCYKIDRLVRFKKSEIDEWMNGLRREPVDVAAKARAVFNGFERAVDRVDPAVIVSDCIETVTGNSYTFPKRETRPRPKKGG